MRSKPGGDFGIEDQKVGSSTELRRSGPSAVGQKVTTWREKVPEGHWAGVEGYWLRDRRWPQRARKTDSAVLAGGKGKMTGSDGLGDNRTVQGPKGR